MEWSTACPDWERRVMERESLIPPPIYPDEAARRAGQGKFAAGRPPLAVVK